SAIAADARCPRRKAASCSAMRTSSRARSASVTCAASAMSVLPLSRQGSRAALGQLVGDDHALDLRGPFPNPVHSKLPIEAFGHVLPHVPSPSEDLHGPVGHP